MSFYRGERGGFRAGYTGLHGGFPAPNISGRRILRETIALGYAEADSLLQIAAFETSKPEIQAQAALH